MSIQENINLLETALNESGAHDNEYYVKGFDYACDGSDAQEMRFEKDGTLFAATYCDSSGAWSVDELAND